MAKTASSAERVAAAAIALGLDTKVVEMPASTRTAEEAAAACGCERDQIVKSLVFEAADDQRLVLLLIAGGRQADLEIAANIAGSDLTRADPKKVRAVTGFAIGGVAPIGHLTPIDVYFDPRLLDFHAVWAAAGAPNKVFRVDPKALIQAIRALPLG